MGIADPPANALDRMLEPLSHSLGVEAARHLIALRIGPEVQERISELAELCNEGLLDDAQRAEYEGYVEGADILALVKLKARRHLADHGEA